MRAPIVAGRARLWKCSATTSPPSATTPTVPRCSGEAARARPPRQPLEPDTPVPGKGVEETTAWDLRGEDVKQHLPDPSSGRTRAVPRRGDDPSTLPPPPAAPP